MPSLIEVRQEDVLGMQSVVRCIAKGRSVDNSWLTQSPAESDGRRSRQSAINLRLEQHSGAFQEIPWII